MVAAPFRQLPAASRQRGLAAIGFELSPPAEVELEPVGGGPIVVRCCERRAGKTVGELEIAVFQAALVIDRDGILEEKVRGVVEEATAAGARVLTPIPVSLPGASGYRGDAELVRPMGTQRPALPYVYVFAMASHDLGVDGGVLVTVRCATPDWPAADQLLRSLRILSRRGTAANDVEASAAAPAQLPMIGSRED
jgi:hypothetical protein